MLATKPISHSISLFSRLRNCPSSPRSGLLAIFSRRRRRHRRRHRLIPLAVASSPSTLPFGRLQIRRPRAEDEIGEENTRRLIRVGSRRPGRGGEEIARPFSEPIANRDMNAICYENVVAYSRGRRRGTASQRVTGCCSHARYRSSSSSSSLGRKNFNFPAKEPLVRSGGGEERRRRMKEGDERGERVREEEGCFTK